MSIIGSNALAGASGQSAGGGGAGGYEISRSVRLNSADSAYFSRTPSSASNRKTWTWSGWVKRSNVGSSARNALFNVGTSLPGNSGFFGVRFQADNTLNVTTGSTSLITTTRVFRDVSAWYHIVVTGDTTLSSNQFKIYVNGVLDTQGGSLSVNTDLAINNNVVHEIGRTSWSTNEHFNGYLADVHFIDGQALAASDFGEYDANGVWQPIEYTGTYGTNGFYLDFSDNSSASALGTDSSGNNNDWTVNNLNAQSSYTPVTPGSGYNDNTLGYYLNGNPPLFLTREPNGTNRASSVSHGSSTGTTWAVNDVLQWAIDWNGGNIWFGRNNTWYSGDPSTGTNPSVSSVANQNLYLALHYNSSNFELQVPSSASYTLPSGFSYWGGATLGTWKVSGTNQGGTPDIFSTTIPTSGKIYIEAIIKGGTNIYANVGLMNLGEVFVSPDSLIDTPTNYEADSGNNGGNYATLNPAFGTVTGSTNSPENGNLTVNGGSSANFSPTTIPVTSGKWYVEVTVAGSGNSSTVGIWKMPMTYGTNYYQNENYRYYQQDGKIYDESAATSNTYSTYAAGDVIGIALDMDNGKVFFSKNGTFQGSSVPASGTNPAASGLSGTWAIALQAGASTSHTLHLNAGQRSYSYTPPTGFLSLCTTNLPDPTIADGSTAMDVALYTGNGSSQSITGLGFSPDFVWLKSRSAAYHHRLFDVIRGQSSLSSDRTNAEGTSANSSLTSFDANGFSITQTTDESYNQSTVTYVGWAWDGGTSTVSNTDGSITSSVRANASAGFSIVSYTGNGSAGATVGHGLNASPGFVIIKVRNGTAGWFVWHSSEPDKYLAFDTSAAVSNTGILPVTNSTIQFKAGYSLYNANTFNYIAYCFTPVEGYSAFGSYTGNGSADGPFVFTGFRPRWLMTKRTDSATSGDWNLVDTARGTYNVVGPYLYANQTAGEGTASIYDILSNGFKIRESGAGTNASGGTYIYAAFGDPFKTARAR